jgi:hypothetical protein
MFKYIFLLVIITTIPGETMRRGILEFGHPCVPVI